MDEPRDTQPPSGSRAPMVGVAKLPPAQQAYSDYTAHSLHCPRCRDVDAGSCGEEKRLRHAWLDLCDDVFRRLGSEGA